MPQPVSYVFLKPHVLTPQDRDSQRQAIDNVIKQAIRSAGLPIEGKEGDGLEVTNITEDLIQRVFESDLLIIDANNYKTTTTLPYLYYLIALGHALGNSTILISQTTEHLPHSLIKHHTLTYSPERVFEFIDKFREVVEEILQKRNNRPDNPIQIYWRDKQVTQILHEQQAAIAEQDEEIKRLKSQQYQPPINFRKVTK